MWSKKWMDEREEERGNKVRAVWSDSALLLTGSRRLSQNEAETRCNFVCLLLLLFVLVLHPKPRISPPPPPPSPSQMLFGWEDVLVAARNWIWIVLPYIISLISCQCSHICWLCALLRTHNPNHTRHLIGWFKWMSLLCRRRCLRCVVDALSLDHYQVSKSFLHGHDTYVNVIARLHGSTTQPLSFLIRYSSSSDISTIQETLTDCIMWRGVRNR